MMLSTIAAQGPVRPVVMLRGIMRNIYTQY
jgi:hypothetical protein